MPTIQELAQQEKAKRLLEERYSKERGSLKQFIKSYWELERKETLVDNRHIDVICNALERVHRRELKRLIICVPPRSLKTEIVSKAYPAWSM